MHRGLNAKIRALEMRIHVKQMRTGCDTCYNEMGSNNSAIPLGVKGGLSELAFSHIREKLASLRLICPKLGSVIK
jgi:hypothetical protein